MLTSFRTLFAPCSFAILFGCQSLPTTVPSTRVDPPLTARDSVGPCDKLTDYKRDDCISAQKNRELALEGKQIDAAIKKILEDGERTIAAPITPPRK